MLYVTKKG